MGLCRGAQKEPGTRGWGDCICIPAAAPKVWHDARGGPKIGEGGSSPLHPRQENWSPFPLWKTELKPRGHRAGPEAAGAESPAPAPHGLGAFPRLRTRGAGLSQPVWLSWLQSCPVMPSQPVLPPWAAISGLWQPPWGHVLTWGTGEHGSGASLPAAVRAGACPSSGGLWGHHLTVSPAHM